MKELADKAGVTPLSGKEARQLRSRGHHLSPTVMIGQSGISEGVVAAIAEAFVETDLIKIKVLDTTDMDRKEFAVELAGITGSQVAQVIGKTVLLYREKKDEDSSGNK